QLLVPWSSIPLASSIAKIPYVHHSSGCHHARNLPASRTGLLELRSAAHIASCFSASLFSLAALLRHVISTCSSSYSCSRLVTWEWGAESKRMWSRRRAGRRAVDRRRGWGEIRWAGASVQCAG